MKNKQTYVAPATGIHSLIGRTALLQLSSTGPTAGFVSNPGVGDAGDGDEIGTESRRTGDGFWDE